MSIRAALSWVGGGVLFFAVPTWARAETPTDRLGAEALAEEAARFMARGDYETGCLKYE